MIEGIRSKALKLIPDERGFLMEMLRSDDAVFEKFGQAYMTGAVRGMAKAWHYHKVQTDNFVCVFGRALVVLCDMRQGSPTYNEVNEFILESPSLSNGKTTAGGSGPNLLQIPPYILHGFTAYNSEEARIINIPTMLYQYDQPDEYRLPFDSPEVPYIWPDYIIGGG
ncbi:MAG: dTDP-4-dehydrorhamnose 3,5-epimerase family protein [Actinomycetota bacterium]|nr:dTDP-4-dehydrorhamnose 3,5-epimerase family protein [Actinomycetota bacterium]